MGFFCMLSLIEGAIPQRRLSPSIGCAISHPTNIALGSRSPMDVESSVERPAFGIQNPTGKRPSEAALRVRAIDFPPRADRNHGSKGLDGDNVLKSSQGR